jgi:hypothetical protein
MPVLAVKPIVQRIGRLILVAIGCWLLIVISVQGYKNAMRNTTDLQTTAQYLMTISQFLYAALGPCVVILRFVSLRWLYAAWRAWAFFFITAAALVPWAWIEPSLLQTLGFALAASVAAGLMSLLVFCGAQPKTLQGAAPE